VARTPYVHLDAPLDDDAEVGDRVPLAGDDEHHLRRVLRTALGAPLEVADGCGGTAQAVLGDGVIELTGPVTRVPPPHPTIEVAQALPKGRKLDEVVRQVTELGADAIVPVAAARSVTAVTGDKATKATARWTAVARAACSQARRPHRPSVATPVDVDGLLERCVAASLLVAVPGAPRGLQDAVERHASHLVVAIGPEGGWTDEEVDRLVGAGAAAVGLGPHVLRTEHAAAAAVAVLAAATGRWHGAGPG
jgi:16S rRNA (uracil1498-N3)-methyltransferase